MEFLDDLDSILQDCIPQEDANKSMPGLTTTSDQAQTPLPPAKPDTNVTITAPASQKSHDISIDTSQLDDLLSKMEQAPPAVPATPPTTEAATDDLDTSQLDDLINKMEQAEMSGNNSTQTSTQLQRDATRRCSECLDTSQLDALITQMQQTTTATAIVTPQTDATTTTTTDATAAAAAPTTKVIDVPDRIEREEMRKDDNDKESLDTSLSSSPPQAPSGASSAIQSPQTHEMTTPKTLTLTSPQNTTESNNNNNNINPSSHSLPTTDNSNSPSSSSSSSSAVAATAAAAEGKASPLIVPSWGTDDSFSSLPEILNEMHAASLEMQESGYTEDDSNDMYGPSSGSPPPPVSRKTPPLPQKRFAVYTSQTHGNEPQTTPSSSPAPAPAAATAAAGIEPKQPPIPQQAQTATEFPMQIVVDIKESNNPMFQESTYERLALDCRAGVSQYAGRDMDMVWEDVRVSVAHGIWALMNLDNNNLSMFEDLVASFMEKNEGATCPERLAGVLRVLEACDTAVEQTEVGFLFPLLEAFFAALAFTPHQVRHGINLARNALNTQTLNAWFVSHFVPVLRGVCAHFLSSYARRAAVLVCKRQWKRFVFLRRLAAVTRWYNPQKVRSFRHLIEDERALAEDLRAADENIRTPLLELAANADTAVLTAEEVNTLFAQFCVLRDTQTNLLAALDEVAKYWPQLYYGPDLVVAHAYHFTAYNDYVIGIDDIEKRIALLKKKNKAFTTFLEKNIAKYGSKGDIVEVMKLPVRYLRIYDKFLSWLKTADSTELQDKALRIIEGAKKSARATFEDSRDKSITAEKLEALRPTAASFMDMDADRKFITSFPEVTVYYTKRRGIVGAIVTDNNSSSSTTTSSSSSSSTTSTSSSSSSGNNDESEERCLYLFTDVLAIITRKKTKKNKRPKLTMKDCLSLSEVVLLRDNNNSNSNSDPRVLRLWYDKSIITIRLASPDERETLWFELGARAKMVAQEGTDPSQVPSPPEVITALPRIVEAEGRAALGVPMLVENSCRYLAEHLDQPGLFRVAGSRELAMGVYRLVEADPKHRIPSRSEPYMVAYVLKTFLQRLDTPLATTELYSDYIELATFESEMVQADPVGRRDTIAREAALIYDRMPFVNLQTYLLVIDLLSRIAEKSALNTMSVRNLAAIFTPNIFGCKGANNKEFTNVQKLTHLMESLIEYQPVIKSLMSVKQTVFL